MLVQSHPYAKQSGQTRALTAAILALGCCLTVTLMWWFTRASIENNQHILLQRQLEAVLKPVEFSNDLLSNPSVLRTATGEITSYAAKNNGLVVATVYDTITGEGYSGAIRLLIGIDHEDAITGVRVMSHRETPGLGDAIEISKSDWITGFDNLSLQQLQPADWQVKKDGGRFHQFTGATITPRAIINAVHDTLQLHQKLHHSEPEPEPESDSESE